MSIGKFIRGFRAPSRTGAPAALALALGGLIAAGPAEAIDFEYGEIRGSLINTVSAGFQMRVADRDPRFLNAANGGDPFLNMTPNADDNNKHFDQGDIVSSPLKLVTELNMSWQNLGFYGRGTAFYDHVLNENDLAEFGDPTSPTYGRLLGPARDKAGKGAEVQDLFVRGEFDIGTQPLNVRVGQQTLNWGEALFTQNAISIINPLDLQKLVIPGSELRDGLIPVPMAWASYEIFEGLAIEGFYQWEFKKLRLPPSGTYFGAADVIEESNDGISGVSNGGDCRSALQALPCLRQLANKDPGDGGNWGVKLNYYSEALNNTEFGLYFVRYTSRFPSLNYVVGPNAGLASVLRTLGGGDLYYRNSWSQTEYARGIKMVGLSYNTTLDEPGIAVNGEFHYKMDVPGGVYGTTPYLQALCQNGTDSLLTALFGAGGLCNNQLDPTAALANTPGEVRGWVPLNQASTNIRLTKIFFQANPFVEALGAESFTVINETSVNYITNLPSSISMSPQITNSCGAAASFGGEGTCAVHQATKVSSYTNFLFQLSYPGAFGSPINLTPALYYGMTIQGNSPVAAGPQSGFKAMNLSLKGEYQQNLTATINFAKQWGGGFRNLNADKDFVGFTVNYAF